MLRQAVIRGRAEDDYSSAIELEEEAGMAVGSSEKSRALVLGPPLDDLGSVANVGPSYSICQSAQSEPIK